MRLSNRFALVTVTHKALGVVDKAAIAMTRDLNATQAKGELQRIVARVMADRNGPRTQHPTYTVRGECISTVAMVEPERAAWLYAKSLSDSKAKAKARA